MSHQLLVIEADSTPLDASVSAALRNDSGFTCLRQSWDALSADKLAQPVDGIVAVAVPGSAASENAFRWLRERPASTATFAVFPADVGEAFLCAATESVDDFVLCPLRASELRHRLNRLLGSPQAEVEGVREKLLEEMSRAQLIGEDPVFINAIKDIPHYARSGLPVLITGETGTGKELCARAIHHLGPRRDFPFIAVDCGTLPDHLIENELFGHARGAFTDAHRDQKGLVAMAEGGTLFLDEVDALSLPAQGKLLRFLQDRTYRPLGAERVQSADVNVIAATNRNLESVVESKQFRPDLFYRLNVLRLCLPALRDRIGDVAILAAHFLAASRDSGAVAGRSLSAAALSILMQHDWPGNVRELANVIRRAAVSCGAGPILPRHVVLSQSGGPLMEPALSFHSARAAALATFERRYITELLERHAGNVTRAAREARKDRRVFGRLMKKYGIRGAGRPQCANREHRSS